PAGTITHTNRGVGIVVTRSARVATSITSGLRSKPVTSIPLLRRRSRIFPPILPRPTSPICMGRPISAGAGWAAAGICSYQRPAGPRRLARDEYRPWLVRVFGLRERNTHELGVNCTQSIEKELGFE